MEVIVMSFQHDDHNRNYPSDTNESKRQTNWIPWLLVVILGGLVMFNYFGINGNNLLSAGGLNWLPVLLSLICPLMMLFMMFGMGHAHHGGNQKNGSSGHGGCCGEQPANKASDK
jgi:amino acid transporter